MGNSIQLPTQIRLMSGPEYSIVTRVFEDTLPYRIRILITNAAGADGRAFTIPTALIGAILAMPSTAFLAGVPGAVGIGYLASLTNLAYLMNVGDDYNNLTGSAKALLVHETTHVWQGKNSAFALSYVFNSIYNQCVKSNAYGYAAGQAWSSYNVEQQASIVEDWFAAGESTSSPLYHYITDNVRKGDA